MAFTRILLCAALALFLTPAAICGPKIIENNFGDLNPGGTTGDASPPYVPPAADPGGGNSARTVGGPAIWSMPQLQQRVMKLRLGAALLFKQARFDEAEKLAQQGVELVPHDAAGYYLLGSIQAKAGKGDAAMLSLSRAVDRGFNKSEEMSRDPNLQSLHDRLRFAELVAAARVAEKPPNPWSRDVRPVRVEGGIAAVAAANTAWDSKSGMFVALFALPPAAPTEEVVKGRPAEKINQWYREGTAAGNHGDYYDNHDNKHSMPPLKNFPQVTKILYAPDAKQQNMHQGLQTRYLFNGVVVGNSSTALVGNPFWRSQPRLGYVNRRRVTGMYFQYQNNVVYCYPEHRDHDAEHGDTFPANTPYVFISQGSSSSDKAFMTAVYYTLAALRPEVKDHLKKNNALMPTIQLIARYCHKNLKAPEDYLTGIAHPTVFEGNGLSVDRMVESAHALTMDRLPPLVKLNVVKDDASQLGRDFFDIPRGQTIFTTPCAIARVHRTTNYKYRMVVSAEESSDLNDRDLTYHWKVLRGDAERIEINPLNEEGSVVELLVPFHPQQEIPGSRLKSSRVDIGCFVHNGQFYSAPAFVTFFSLPNEERGYRADGKVAWVQYHTEATGGPYADPMIDTPKTWKDTYEYDGEGKLVGWVREIDGKQGQFTADGAMVIERDEQGRALRAHTVRYVAGQAEAKKAPTLRQARGREILHYEYASPEDRIGRIVRREAVTSN